jgi:hypothetical protein
MRFPANTIAVDTGCCPNGLLIMDCDFPQLLNGRDISTTVTPAAFLSRGPGLIEKLSVNPAD